MKKIDKIFYISLFSAVLLTLLIVFMPNSINNYYSNPEIYDTGFNYYLWKFRPIDASTIARVTSWGFFFLHVITVFVLMYLLKKDKNRKDGLSIYNIYLLLANGIFILLHYIHTWVWYDALAQDTPVWSSQGSVIVMLVLILIMENRRRGLFFGKKVPLPKESTNFVMKNHGAYIAVAIIFTFWYHPMEFTVSHMVGFFYMFILLMQLSLSRTKWHTNRYFNLALEVTVLFHGSSVALTTGNAPWAMFFFGFATIFFVTQIYSLKLSKKTILILQLVYLVFVILYYTGLFSTRQFYEINEVIRIPFIEYILVFVFVYLIYLPIWLNKKFKIPKIVNRIVAILFITVLTLSALLVIYSSSPYQPENAMVEFVDIIVESEDITVTETSSAIVFAQDQYTKNIVFVPGGKVVPASYSYLAAQLASEGYKVTIIKPAFNLAILQPNLGEKYLEEGIENVVIGHSLGGVVGSMIARDNELVDHLILLGSYSPYELPDTVNVLVMTAELDGLTDEQAVLDSLDNYSSYSSFVVSGGNHAYFGYYGDQRGDNEAELSNLNQQIIVYGVIRAYLMD